MRLEVPESEQEEDKGCGPAVLQMVLKYYGVDISQEKIIEKHGGLTKWGSYTVGLGLIAQQLGFEVTCYSYFLHKMSHKDFDKDKKVLLSSLDEKIEDEEDEYWERELETFKKFIEEGNDIVFDIPRSSEIKSHLREGRPVIIALNSSSLFERDIDLDLGHYVVLTGYENGKFLLNDPENRIEEIEEERLIFASSNNVFESSAYMLIVEDK